jgi:ABC-type polysaccharide transport system permease subunit
VLTLLALGCLLLPNVTVSFTQPGKNKVQATATIRGLDAVTFSAADKLADPMTAKGKPVYKEEDEDYSRQAVNAATAGMAGTFTWLTWAAMVLILGTLVLLLMGKNKKLAILLLLAAAVLRIVTWLCASRGLPRAVATGNGEMYLYASIPLLIFGAFFAYFADREELPKKYKLFLMMLPFLLAVFLFAYLPLYGWSYAFYNYKFGLPMDQQEFVGFKWFTEMVSNPANRDNIVRVLKNTLGMSGLNLATSWLPMIFAVFLNEITRTRFKKFVQIFTTLPNFISWALVFSFAMCLFAADTGIYSKLMMDLGMNDPANPTVWLNSGDHIWLKMWGWSTWKGLGWGAIMYLAAISGIDQELYEAARVDGANRWALIRHITLPGLLPTFFVLLMLSISNILNNGMDQYLVFQNPMNRQTIEVLDLYVYNITIASGGTALYSYATAIGILKTLVSVTLLFTANFLSKKLRGESIM